MPQRAQQSKLHSCKFPCTCPNSGCCLRTALLPTVILCEICFLESAELSHWSSHRRAATPLDGAFGNAGRGGALGVARDLLLVASTGQPHHEAGGWDQQAFGLLLHSEPHLLWFLFITHKSFAFY